MKLRFSGALILSAALITGCRPSAIETHMPAAQKSTRLEHPNGLVLELPESYRATQHADGFEVEGDPAVMLRSPLRVRVSWLPTRFPLTNAKLRQVEPGRMFEYAMTVAEGGGSGGQEYALTACQLMGTRSLCLWQTKLGKHDAPPFELWALAAGTSVRP